MTREEAIELLKDIIGFVEDNQGRDYDTAFRMAIEALSAEAVPQSEQYKKGYEDAKRAFLIEYARESENMRKRNAQLEVMLNAQKAISAEAVQEWMTGKPTENGKYMVTLDAWGHRYIDIMHYSKPMLPSRKVKGMCWYKADNEWGDIVYDDEDILAWMPLPKPYREDGEA